MQSLYGLYPRGARDSLRLECGLCLYGHDLDRTTTSVETSLLWAMSLARRADRKRAGGFPSAELILEQIQSKKVDRVNILDYRGRLKHLCVKGPSYLMGMIMKKFLQRFGVKKTSDDGGENAICCSELLLRLIGLKIVVFVELVMPRRFN